VEGMGDSQTIKKQIYMNKSGLKKFANEFKEFAVRGNVVDMAVGVIIGGAFGKIVTSLVNDVIMHLITLMTGAADFTKLSIVLREPVVENGKTMSEGISLMYGNFIQSAIDFFIIALVIFIMLKFIMKLSSLRKKEEEEVVKEVKGPSTEELFIEIRDLLKKEKESK